MKKLFDMLLRVENECIIIFTRMYKPITFIITFIEMRKKSINPAGMK